MTTQELYQYLQSKDLYYEIYETENGTDPSARTDGLLPEGCAQGKNFWSPGQ